jgi:hypothetical protein
MLLSQLCQTHFYSRKKLEKEGLREYEVEVFNHEPARTIAKMKDKDVCITFIVPEFCSELELISLIPWKSGTIEYNTKKLLILNSHAFICKLYDMSNENDVNNKESCHRTTEIVVLNL